MTPAPQQPKTGGVLRGIYRKIKNFFQRIMPMVQKAVIAGDKVARPAMNNRPPNADAVAVYLKNFLVTAILTLTQPTLAPVPVT